MPVRIDFDESECARAGGVVVMRRAAVAILAGLCVLTGALAIQFTRLEIPDWTRMNFPLLVGTLSLSAAVVFHAVFTRSAGNAALFFSLAFGISLAAEWAGTRWGLPFGARYAYHPDLVPRLLGNIPVFIPLSWTVIGYVPLVLLRERHPGPEPGLPRLVTRAALASAMLVGTDLYLDPLAVSVGAWTWERSGPWFGVPTANFSGWAFVGLLVYGSFFALEARMPASPRRLPPAWDRILVATSLFLAVTAHVALARRVPGGTRVLFVTLPLCGLPFLLWFAREFRGEGSVTKGRT